jgi:hypothetical protein
MESGASVGRRNGAAMASVVRCVFPTAVADNQTLSKAGGAHIRRLAKIIRTRKNDSSFARECGQFAWGSWRGELSKTR